MHAILSGYLHHLIYFRCNLVRYMLLSFPSHGWGNWDTESWNGHPRSQNGGGTQTQYWETWKFMAFTIRCFISEASCFLWEEGRWPLILSLHTSFPQPYIWDPQWWCLPRKGWPVRKESFPLCSLKAPEGSQSSGSSTGDALLRAQGSGVWLPVKKFPFPRGRLHRKDGHLGTTFLMFLWLRVLLISLSVFSYGVSVSFLAWFVTFLHFCLFLIIWPNTFVFIWFFFPPQTSGVYDL